MAIVGFKSLKRVKGEFEVAQLSLEKLKKGIPCMVGCSSRRPCMGVWVVRGIRDG